MEGKLSRAAKKIVPSSIQGFSHLAQRCNAINLAEGFPDFPAPPHIKNAAISAINSDFNQYRNVQGVCDYLAKMMKERHGLDIDPLTDVAICCGQSEAFAAAILATIDPGDEVILFDPSYESYEACVAMAGGVPIHVPLDPPQWTLDSSKLLGSFTERTKVVVLNSPHNPTGKVFTKGELEVIAGECCSRNCLAITDEVYEHITYDNLKHISLVSFPGMQERTVITSSLSKSFSVTGWRIGWAVAPTFLASAIKNIHVRLTDSAPAPFQEAALNALRSPPEYFESLRSDYQSRRDYIVNLLGGVGFKIEFIPQGSFFLFAELPDNCPLSDVEFVKKLILEAGVVAVPGRGFFHTNLSSDEVSNLPYSYQKRYIRFAFCKSDATLTLAAEKLGKLLDAKGHLVLY
ncbi:hypothetical protein VIGAN_08255700 [Vigna angularis var. angularis]|uniref:Aminotransferase class I/classII large domain-containing protein n=2 Tax=Phaseolus angularis TaxID=3914 RepID=A0A0S3SSF8_PHAAN|nr:uncharacterized protein LOC108325219 isoform X1 [Vigna angularis]BAT95763.1 hypothetical protein VIGAN_08255700 [Vigna angularis var. angularis]